MTFPVKIEHGNHSITAPMHALPRPGDRLECAFPASGIPKLFLMVDRVYFHQPVEFDGRECPEPFWIVLTTKEDPDSTAQKHNKDVFAKLVKPSK